MTSLHHDQPHHPSNPKFGQPTGRMEMDLNPPAGPVGSGQFSAEEAKSAPPPAGDPNAPAGRATAAQPRSAPTNADPIGGDLSASAARTTAGETFTTTSSKATREGEEIYHTSGSGADYSNRSQQTTSAQHQQSTHAGDQKTNIAGERTTGTGGQFLGTDKPQSSDKHKHSSEIPSKGSGTKIYSDQAFDSAPSHHRPVREVEDPGHSNYATKYHDDESEDFTKTGVSESAKQAGVAEIIPGGFAASSDKGSKKYPDIAPNAPSHHHVAKEQIDPSARGDYDSKNAKPTKQHTTTTSAPKHTTHHHAQQQPGIPSTADYGVDAYESKAAKGRPEEYGEFENPVKNATIPGQEPLQTGERGTSINAPIVSATSVGGGGRTGKSTDTSSSTKYSGDSTNVPTTSDIKGYSATNPSESQTGQYQKGASQELHQTTSNSSSKSHHGIMDTLVDKTKNLFGDKRRNEKDSKSPTSTSPTTSHSGTSGTYTGKGASVGESEAAFLGNENAGKPKEHHPRFYETEAFHAGSMNPNRGAQETATHAHSGEGSYGGSADPNESPAYKQTSTTAQNNPVSGTSDSSKWKPSTFTSEGQQGAHTGRGYEATGAAVTGATGNQSSHEHKTQEGKSNINDLKTNVNELKSNVNDLKSNVNDLKSNEQSNVNDFGNRTKF